MGWRNKFQWWKRDSGDKSRLANRGELRHTGAITIRERRFCSISFLVMLGGRLKSIHWVIIVEKDKWGRQVAKSRSGGMVAMCCSIVAFQRAPCIYNETHYCTPAPPSEARGAA